MIAIILSNKIYLNNHGETISQIHITKIGIVESKFEEILC
jgi:hypothetical protein